MRLIDADALKYALGSSDAEIYFDGLIDEMPTITAQSGWIPCSERLPVRENGSLIRRDWFLVTLETGMVTIRAFEYEQDSPFGYGFHEQNKIRIVAWQKMPDPYQGEA